MTGVVVGKEFRSLLSLLGRIECAIGQSREVNIRSGYWPIDLLHGNVIRSPCFDPSVEAGHHRLVGVVGISGGQRLETVEGVQVPHSPGDQRRKSAGCDQNTSEN